MKSIDINITDNETKVIKKMLEFLEGNDYIQYLGIEMLELETGYGYGRMPYKKDVLNPYNSVHGGVLYSFADIVSGTTAAVDNSTGRFATTINGSLNFLEQAANTEYLYCKATCLRNGKSLAVYTVEITDDNGKLIDEGSFSFYKTSMKVFEE